MLGDLVLRGIRLGLNCPQPFFAILGDQVELGCNAVCNPGSVAGRASRVYPLAGLRGFLPERIILKAGGQRVVMKGRAGEAES